MQMKDIIDDVVKRMGEELSIDFAQKKIDAMPHTNEIRGAVAFALVRGAPEHERLPALVRVAARLLLAKRVVFPITLHGANRDIYHLASKYALQHDLDSLRE